MQLMFLNESTVVAETDEMAIYCEAEGISLEGIEDREALEVCLECETECSLAEVEAMREEFACIGLYNEGKEEGLVSRVVATLKKWWTAIKTAVIKAWFAIVNFVMKVVVKVRELIQKAFMKVTGRTNLKINSALLAEMNAYPTDVEDLMKKLPATTFTGMEGSVKATDATFAKASKADASKGAFEDIAVEAWKAAMNKVLKTMDGLRTKAQAFKNAVAKAVAANDAKLKAIESKIAAAKDGKSADLDAQKKEFLTIGKNLSGSRSVGANYFGKCVRFGYTLLNKAFTGIKTSVPVPPSEKKD